MAAYPDNMAEPKRNDPAPLSPQPTAGGIAARALGARATPYLADLNPMGRFWYSPEPEPARRACLPRASRTY